MAKPSRKCIFCGQGDLSKEHVWPQWTYNYIPKLTNASHVRVTVESVPYSPRITGVKDYKKYQGDVSTITVRAVCRNNCNGGWMSRLEERTKTVLIPLIQGRPIILGSHDQQLLAAWIAMKVMVAEQSQPEVAVSTQEHRDFLMAHQKPPDFWRIWIGRRRGSLWNSGYHRHSITLGPVVDGKPVPPNGSLSKNTQAVTMGVGELMFHVVSCSLPDSSFILPREIDRVVFRLWPYTSGIVWPPSNILTDPDVDEITQGLEKFARGLKWSSGR